MVSMLVYLSFCIVEAYAASGMSPATKQALHLFLEDSEYVFLVCVDFV